MAARKSLSKLTLPTDIGNEERFLSHRQSLIQEKLLKCYAEEIACTISVLVVENCNGCIIDHPSQRQHPCLMMENEERFFGRDPPVYKLKDYDGEELKGTFYDKELQKVVKDDDVYEVEKILKKRGRGSKVQYLVKWLGYPNKFNSW